MAEESRIPPTTTADGGEAAVPAVPAPGTTGEDLQSEASRPETAAPSIFSLGGNSAPSLPTVDDDQSDASDGVSLGSVSFRSSTQSLASSIYNFVEENGRTYHRYKEGKYLLPNDATEQERLDLQHHLFLVTLNNKLGLAPIEANPERVLDIATGTGNWAIEFATRNPNSQVIGTDLSPIQPEFIPANCSFEIDDAEDPWTFNEPFDYIHGRALLSCFKDPKEVIQQAFNSLKPGGHLELQDGRFPMCYIGDAPVDSALYRWNTMVLQGARMTPRPWDNVQHYKRWMEEVGFEDVKENIYYWPTNPWPKGKYLKVVSMLFQQDMMNGLEGISLRVLGLLGWDPAKTKEFIEEVKRDFKDPNIHSYLNIVIIHGRKPMNAPVNTESVPVDQPAEGSSATAPSS